MRHDSDDSLVPANLDPFGISFLNVCFLQSAMVDCQIVGEIKWLSIVKRAPVKKMLYILRLPG